MVTGLPFVSTFFFIANFCLFCRKGKSSVVTAQPFFLFPRRVVTIYYAGNPYLCYGAKIILPPPTQYPPSCLSPPPLAPGGGGYHGRSGGRGNGKLYLATQKARAAAARRKEARANLLAPPPSTPSNRAIR